MQNYDWQKFKLRITVHSSIRELYNLWTTQEGLEKWFLRKAEFKKPDQNLRTRTENIQTYDSYEWMWHGYDDHIVEHGRILNANGKDFLQFTFTAGCIVTVKIFEETENLIELSQENFPADENDRIKFHFDCSRGWTFYLTNLKSILEGGIDLRNRKVEIQNVVNA